MQFNILLQRCSFSLPFTFSPTLTVKSYFQSYSYSLFQPYFHSHSRSNSLLYRTCNILLNIWNWLFFLYQFIYLFGTLSGALWQCWSHAERCLDQVSTDLWSKVIRQINDVCGYITFVSVWLGVSPFHSAILILNILSIVSHIWQDYSISLSLQNSLSLSLSLSHSLSVSLTLSLTHSLTYSLSLSLSH